MNKYLTTALAGIVIGACGTMATEGGPLAIADTDAVDSETESQIRQLQDAIDDLWTNDQVRKTKMEELEQQFAALDARVAELEMKSPGLGAYDAEGNLLGAVVEHEAGEEIGSVKRARVYNPQLERVLLLTNIESHSMLGDRLYYDQPNCGGNLYSRASDATDVGVYANGFLSVPVGEPIEVAIKSNRLLTTDECVNSDPPVIQSSYRLELVDPPFPLPIKRPITIR